MIPLPNSLGQPPRASRQSSITTLYVKGKRVATIINGTLRQSRHGSKHFLRYPEPAICFDRDLLDRARAAGATRVVVRDIESGFDYRAGLSFVQAAGFPIHRGHGSQVALPLSAWVVVGNQTDQKNLLDHRIVECDNAQAEQLELFSGGDA